MDSATANEYFASLKHDEKVLMLANVAYNLTIAARDTYSVDGGVAEPGRLRGLNEVQHHTLAVLRALACGTSEPRMSDEEVVTMFLRPREDRALVALLAFAFDQAAAQTSQRSDEVVKARP